MVKVLKKKKTVLVNFSHALFYLLDFLTLQEGSNTLSRNVGTELLLNAV